MEEILASIRRILNDDDVPTPAEKPAQQEEEEDDVLILDDTMRVGPVEVPAEVPDEEPRRTDEPDAAEEVAPEEVAVEPVAVVQPVALPAAAKPPHRQTEGQAVSQADPFDQPDPASDLLAPEAAAAAALSLGTLVKTLSASRGPQLYTGGPTLEDMVRAELRPLLKGWLDTNLPPMVERLVRAEIEKVVGRLVP